MDESQIPYFDLKAQYRSIKFEIDAAVSRVLESCEFVLGSEVARFEKEFAAHSGTSECIAVNSGTSALHIALLAAGVRPGDEVITVPFTFVASVAAILYVGAIPVLVDIDPRTFNIDPSAVQDAITSRTKAILPVHLYGQTADMDPIMECARRHGLVVIEDAAQAHGAEYKGRRAGSMGHFGCFSFYPTKNLGAYGEGGAVVTNNSGSAEMMRKLRNWGQDSKYHHVSRGFNYRMEAIQGAVLLAKLGHLDEWTAKRRWLAERYNELLVNSSVMLPTEMPWARHVYHVFTLRSKDRDALQLELRSQGIQTAVHYSRPVHLQPAYSDLGYVRGSFPEAERAAREVLSLPIFPEMNEKQIQRVARAIETAAPRVTA